MTQEAQIEHKYSTENNHSNSKSVILDSVNIDKIQIPPQGKRTKPIIKNIPVDIFTLFLVQEN